MDKENLRDGYVDTPGADEACFTIKICKLVLINATNTNTGGIMFQALCLASDITTVNLGQ